MVNEKIEAGLALQAKALSGGLGATALSLAAKTLVHHLPRIGDVLAKVPLGGHIDLNEDS